MITSKTYTGVAGQNFIQGAELAFATIYVVKRNGTGYNKYVSGDSNRTYIHDDSSGKILFPDIFSSDFPEKIFVLYKTLSVSPEPEVCEIITIEDSTMPNGIVNVSYSHQFPLGGTPPYFLNVIDKPDWPVCNVQISMFGVVTIMGFPDAPGTESLIFEVSNCGGTIPVNKTFTVSPNSENIFFASPGFSQIVTVTGVSYTITTGSLPVYLSNSASGIHPDYTGQIHVTVSSIIFPRTLRLYKNNVLIESIPVPSNGTYSFASNTYLEADVIKILL